MDMSPDQSLASAMNTNLVVSKCQLKARHGVVSLIVDSSSYLPFKPGINYNESAYFE